MRHFRPVLRIVLLSLLAILLIGFLLPSSLIIPVVGATARDWNPQSFWYEPWGKSGVHKGIDIFAAQGRPVRAACPGLVIGSGHLARGGNVVLVLCSKWRVHYYAHLDSISPTLPRWVRQGEIVGAVGNSGNAAGRPAHLHYTIVTLVPYPWRYSQVTQGWKRMFFLDPGGLLEASRAQ